jgi:hypothetical protein
VSKRVSKLLIWLADAAHPPRSFAADDPAHRRIMAQAFGIIHIFIAGKSPED